MEETMEMELINARELKLRIMREARIKEVRRNKIILVSVILLAVSLLIVGYNHYRKTFWNQCPKTHTITYEAVYISHGDTVESIARDALSRHNMDNMITVKDEVDAIIQMNKLHNPDRIQYGKFILVPYYVEKGDSHDGYDGNCVARLHF